LPEVFDSEVIEKRGALSSVQQFARRWLRLGIPLLVSDSFRQYSQRRKRKDLDDFLVVLFNNEFKAEKVRIDLLKRQARN
jgi:hypothetical protein